MSSNPLSAWHHQQPLTCTRRKTVGCQLTEYVGTKLHVTMTNTTFHWQSVVTEMKCMFSWNTGLGGLSDFCACSVFWFLRLLALHVLLCEILLFSRVCSCFLGCYSTPQALWLVCVCGCVYSNVSMEREHHNSEAGIYHVLNQHFRQEECIANVRFPVYRLIMCSARQ